MPRGDKSKYTEKQKRQAEKIEKGYEKQGVSEDEAESRAWATVNKMTGGGKKPGGSGHGKPMNTSPAKKRGQVRGQGFGLTFGCSKIIIRQESCQNTGQKEEIAHPG